jgi:hypothetical protein
VPGIDHLGTNTHRFQCSVRTLPINAGALHNYFIWAQRRLPFGQRLTIPSGRSLPSALGIKTRRDACAR